MPSPVKIEVSVAADGAVSGLKAVSTGVAQTMEQIRLEIAKPVDVKPAAGGLDLLTEKLKEHRAHMRAESGIAKVVARDLAALGLDAKGAGGEIAHLVGAFAIGGGLGLAIGTVKLLATAWKELGAEETKAKEELGKWFQDMDDRHKKALVDLQELQDKIDKVTPIQAVAREKSVDDKRLKDLEDQVAKEKALQAELTAGIIENPEMSAVVNDAAIKKSEERVEGLRKQIEKLRAESTDLGTKGQKLFTISGQDQAESDRKARADAAEKERADAEKRAAEVAAIRSKWAKAMADEEARIRMDAEADIAKVGRGSPAAAEITKGRDQKIADMRRAAAEKFAADEEKIEKDHRDVLAREAAVGLDGEAKLVAEAEAKKQSIRERYAMASKGRGGLDLEALSVRQAEEEAAVDAATQRQITAERAREGQQRLSDAAKVATEKKNIEEDAVKELRASGQISASDELRRLTDLENQKHTIRRQALHDQLALEGLTQIERRKLLDEEVLSEAEHERALGRLRNGYDQLRQRAIESDLRPLGSAAAEVFQGIIVRGQSIESVLGSVFSRLSSDAISEITSIGVQFAATAIKRILSSAAIGAAGAASAAADTPIVGPVIAPAAGAATYATIAGYASMVVAERGAVIGPFENPLAQLHRDERVLPADVARKYEAGAGGGRSGPIVNVNLSAMDPRSFHEYLAAHGGNAIRAAVSRAYRDGWRPASP